MSKDYDAPCPGRDHFLKDAKPLSNTAREIFAARRARVNGIKTTKTLETRISNVEEFSLGIEKVHLEPDFLPASFLHTGSVTAGAVCRIRTGSSFGTGFLVAPGILMTNNHVIPSENVANTSAAEFDFEADRDTRRVAINPDRIFITNASLDYTIVGCDMHGIDDISPIPLLRNPALVMEKERVSVIQHPRARQKEVALHDNHVSNLLDRVVRYRTDTDPGSSGSPVFNNQWELVALHHAGQKDRDGTAENEGILISAIVNDLTARSRNEGAESGSELLTQMINDVAGTSPFMGFFDTAGLFDQDNEVQVDSFTGSKDFADVGFWNIEHFNRNISDSRVKRVANVFETLSLDAIGLSEVQEPALGRLVEEMSSRGFNLDFELENVRGGQDLAIVFDADTTKVERLEISDPSFEERIQGKRIFPREPMFAKVLVEETDGRSVEFIMIVVHLKAFGDTLSQNRRRAAAKAMVRIIGDLRAQFDLPVVFGGDFNEQLTTDVLDSIKNAPDLLSITADDADSGAFSFIGSRKSLIDHIVLSDDVKTGAIDGDDAAIVRLDRSVRDFSDKISDHVPLVIRMVFSGSPNVITPPVPIANPGNGAIRIPEDARRVVLTFE